MYMIKMLRHIITMRRNMSALFARYAKQSSGLLKMNGSTMISDGVAIITLD